LPSGIAWGTGRIEADEIDIDTKFVGRIAEILADEGDMVKAGQVVARHGYRDLAASLKKSEAQVQQARKAIEEVNAGVAQQTSLVLLARQQYDRAAYLVEQGAIHLRHPPNFQRDVLGRRRPAVQVNVDATAMVQAGLGSSYAQQIIASEITDFVSRSEGVPLSPVNLAVRIVFNPNVTTAWLTSVMSILNNVTMLAICRSGPRARARARDHGSSSRHAAAVRDCHVQGMGERPGDYGGGRPIPLYRGARVSRGPHCRFETALPARRDDLPVLCDRVGQGSDGALCARRQQSAT
jgi:pyruvate/2-oxoglutarate dehydrogenase complex dihydrolipoamide acyltransferase (E2) component